MKTVEIIVPCYYEELCIKPLYDAVNQVMGELQDYKTTLFFIDDGSRDNTLNEIKKLEEDRVKVKYLSFSRNFGKEAAIFAGLSNVTTSG